MTSYFNCSIESTIIFFRVVWLWSFHYNIHEEKGKIKTIFMKSSNKQQPLNGDIKSSHVMKRKDSWFIKLLTA